MSESLKINWEFHPKQKEAWDSTARFTIVNSGRRGGKGKLGSRKVWKKANENPGGQILVTATTYPQLRDVILPNMNAEMPPGFAVYKKADKEFRCDNGASILLRSIDNPDPLRGLGEFIVYGWHDEFPLYPDSIWDEILMYIYTDNIAPVLFTGTPKGMNKFHQFYLRAMDGDPNYAYFHWTSYDNTIEKGGFLESAALVEYEELKKHSPGVYQQEVMAEFLDELGGVFTGARKCIAGDLEAPQEGETYVAGCDLGKARDFTVPLMMKRSSRAVVDFDRFRHLDWEFQVAKVRAQSNRYFDATVLLDSTGLGDPIFDRLRSLGVPVKGYKFTAESKRKLVENLSLCISQGNIRFPDIPELISELEIYEAKPLPSGGVSYGAPSGYHDDAATALMLACWELSGVGPPVYTEAIRDEAYL